MNKFYIAYDGRAEYDTDKASVLESLGERFTRSDYNTWRDHDAVLVEYDIEEGNQLINENVIGHWREGFKALKAKCIVPISFSRLPEGKE